MTTISFSTTTPGLRRRAMLSLVRVRRGLLHWLDAALAYRERRAALFALGQWNDRELRDIGLNRGQIEKAVGGASRRRARWRG